MTISSHEFDTQTSGIDVVHKCLPIHYSFVLVQISLPRLVVTC